MAGPGQRARGLWVLCGTPFGLGSWAGFAYAARRAGFPRWYAWSVVYAALPIAGFALAGVAEEDTPLSTTAGFLLLIPWAFSFAHALVVRPFYVRRVEAGGFGFGTVDELGMTLDLPGDLVERLRDDVVFLPR